MVVLEATAQTKKVTESVTLNGQSNLDIEFTFSDDITFKTWDKNEVLAEVSINIQDGKYNDIFTLKTDKSSAIITIVMDKNMWKKIPKSDRNNNCKLEY